MENEVKKLERQSAIGDRVIYFDEFGIEREALLSAVWGDRHEGLDWQGNPKVFEPSVNLLFISPDAKREDSYGRQIERRSSCVHVLDQGAYGNAYCLPEQIDEARKKINESKAEFANA